MAYQNVSKQLMLNKVIEVLSIKYPGVNFQEILSESQAEDLLFTIYEELGKIVNPDPNHFPPARN